jgi:hypothetical protein
MQKCKKLYAKIICKNVKIICKNVKNYMQKLYVKLLKYVL